MKHLDLDWGAFLEALPAWKGVPAEARLTVLSLFSKYSVTSIVPHDEAGPTAEVLLSAGILVPSANRSGYKLEDRQKILVRGLRALNRSPMFQAEPVPHLLTFYLQEHFTVEQCEGLLAGATYYTSHQATASIVGSTSWLQGFLDSTSAGAWEQRHLPRRATHQDLQAPESAATLRLLIERLLAAGGPLPLSELARQASDLRLLGQALGAGLRYALFLGGLSPDLVPLVGIWPPLQRRLSAPPPTPPAAVTPRGTCPGGYGLDDLFTLLAACKAEPRRLRQDLQLFAKAQGELEAALAPLPDWIEQAVPVATREDRLVWALNVFWNFNLTRTASRAGKGTLGINAAGDRFLEMSRRERLRLLCPPAKRPKRRGGAADSDRLFPFDLQHWEAAAPDETRNLTAAFLSVPEETFVDLERFLQFQSRRHNPWKTVPVGRQSYGVPVTLEEREDAWLARLSLFFALRLFPLGGVTLGYTAEDRICFALTGIGRYILGESDDFEVADEAPARIVVQPNFDVVFLTPSAETEASLARFAERKARGVGTLFQITRKSILAAAASGLDAGQAFAALEAAAVEEIPGNVRREIETWFGRVRNVGVRTAVLVTCPDAETAARVVAAGGKSLRLLSDTVVELKEPRERNALVRKLRQDGVLVAEDDEAEPAEPVRKARKKVTRRKRRRW